MSDGIKKATWRELALYYLGRRKTFIVNGVSMTPTLTDGDTVLVDPTNKVAVGDIILAKHPYKTDVKIIKRITEIGDNGRLTLSGDNPTESSDSRAFGTVSLESIIGKVTGKLK